MISFFDCARRHGEIASLAVPELPRLVAQVEEEARGVAASPMVRGRIKGLVSTWVKAQTKQRPVDAIYDLVGLRVIVDQVDECYAVLDALRTRWRMAKPVEDYIHEPKANGYESLHAVFEGPSSIHFEVQIRTRDMHEACERGQWSHWLYKRRQLNNVAAPAPPPQVDGWLPQMGGGPLNRLREWKQVRAVRRQEPTRREKVALVAASVALVGLVCLLDWVSGDEIGFSVLYVLPVALASWRVGGVAGVVMAALSTFAWWLTDREFPLTVNPFIQLWEATMRFCIFALLGYTLAGLRAALVQLSAVATTDHLTGVLNGRGFFTVAAAELERARRHGRPLTAVFIDLDDFKQVNDRLGHGPADDLLRRWAQAVRLRLRTSDHLARLGGDEFAILLPEAPAEAARNLLERLRAELAEESRELPLPVTFSMGAVTFTTAPASVDSMLHEADVLMYAAKASGKNCWQHEARAGAGLL